MARDVTFEELEFAGAMAVRFLHIDITDYDPGGESFDETDAGMSRFQMVIPVVVDDSGYKATYVEDDQTIMLHDDNGEAADGSVAEVRVAAIGRE